MTRAGFSDLIGPPPVADPSLRAGQVEARIERLRALAAEGGASGTVLTTRRDSAWLTLGGELHVVLESEDAVAPILVTANRAMVIAPINEADRIADEEVAGLPLEIVSVPWYDDAVVAARAVVGREVAGHDRLLGGTELERVLELERSRLGPIEHDRLRWLGAVTRHALNVARTVLADDPGATETEVAGKLAGVAWKAGARTPVVLAAADERIERYRHPLPADRRSSRRLMVVLVTERWGLHAAGTAIVDVTSPSDDLGRRDAAVERVLAAMTDATRPGATLGAVLDAARERYAAEGFADEWRLHHQGGTIGYRGRERIGVPGDGFALEPGMAVAWNPSITGAKVEATLLIPPEAAAAASEPEVIVGPVHATLAAGSAA